MQRRKIVNAYIVGDITVHDTERYMKYVGRAPDFVKKHNGSAGSADKNRR